MVLQSKAQEQEKNVYLSHIEQDGWNDIQAYHVQNESMWRNIALIAIIALLVVAVYAMYMVNQDKHKVLVFEKDSQGNLATLGIATQVFAIDNKIIAHQLANFILALREVPLDNMVKRQNINLVHSMVDPELQTQVDQLIIAQYTKAKDVAISVEITSVKPLQGGKTWEINWVEKFSPNSSTTQTTNWSTTVTFTRLDTVNPTIQLINPTGLFIKYLHPVQDIINKGI